MKVMKAPHYSFRIHYLHFHAVGHENNPVHLLIESRPRYSP